MGSGQSINYATGIIDFTGGGGGGVSTLSVTSPLLNTGTATDPVIAITAAAVGTAGAVALDNSLTSTSDSTAATSGAVKSAYDTAVAAAAAAATAGADVGDLSTLTTSDQSSAVAAINEINSNVGNLSTLSTTDQSSAVAAINEVNSNVGDLSTLSTTDQSSAVAAINETYLLASNAVAGVTGTAPIVVDNTDPNNPIVSVNAATTGAAGVVQLYDATDSTSTTLALTAAQGKNLQDQIDALAVTSNITLAGTIDTSTGFVNSVTPEGTAAGFVVGAVPPAAAVGNEGYFLIVDVPGSTGPAGVGPYHVGDWFLSDGTAWQFLDVGYQAPAATDTVAGIVRLATPAEVAAGTDNTIAITPFGASSTYVPCAAFTAKGDILSATGAGVPVALSVGTDGQVLYADSASASGLCWGTLPSVPQAQPQLLGTMLGCTVGTYTAVGCNALLSATGINNTAVGVNALCSNTGNGNTGIGTDALRSNTSGLFNSAVGWGALDANQTGGSNAAFGANALGSNTTGTGNVAVGLGTMVINQTGSYNTSVGYSSMNKNCAGNNTAVGALALCSGVTGVCNVAIGVCALVCNQAGSYNTVVGQNAGSNVFGSCNTVIGSGVQVADSLGNRQLAIGWSPTNTWLTGINTRAIKPSAGIIDCADVCGTAGQVLMSNGANAVCWGDAPGSPQAEPQLLGTVFGCTTDDPQNGVALGYGALANEVPSEFNVAIGYNTMAATTTGEGNTAVGAIALSSNTDGTSNTALGSEALSSAVNASGNVAVGRTSLEIATGSLNTAVGTGSGSTITTGQVNTVIGYCTQVPDPAGDCQLAIGFGDPSDPSLQCYWLTGNSTLAIKPGAGIIDCAGSCGTANQVLLSTGANGICWGAAAGSPQAQPLLLGTVYGCTDPATNNVGLGYFTLNGTTGAELVALGRSALNSSSGNFNVAVGVCSMKAAVSGSYNTGVGQQAMCALTSGSYNTAIGSNALCLVTTGNYNTAIGNLAGLNQCTGSHSVAIGVRLCLPVADGSCQLAIGWSPIPGTSQCYWLTGDSTKAIKPGAGIIDCFNSCGLTGQVLCSTGSNSIAWATGFTGIVTFGTCTVTICHGLITNVS